MAFPTSSRRPDNRGTRKDGNDVPRRKGWGSVARKGAAAINDERTGPHEEFERSSPERSSERWVREDAPKPKKKQASRAPKFQLPDSSVKEIEKLAGNQSKRALRYLSSAADAVAAERWKDARASLKVLLEIAPSSPSVRELNGTVLYRTGKWAKALVEFQAAHYTTREYDLHPAMMDCLRALGRNDEVEELWNELREASPSAEVVAEGRIVAASSLADRGNIPAAVALLERAPKVKRGAAMHHLRTWYVLADLYERSGDVTRARNLFQVLVEHDPDFGDAHARLEALM
jgi:tetratricopeptide (TPR) repeat protein